MIYKNEDLRRKHRYGLLPGQFEELHKEQGGRCRGCGKLKPLCVDHDHESGRIRGLLCRTCNATIGLAQEDINILKNLVGYLDYNWKLDHLK